MPEHTGYGIEAFIRKQFQIEEKDIRSYSPLALAYIGDGIYELIIRTIVVSKGNRQVKKLQVIFGIQARLRQRLPQGDRI